MKTTTIIAALATTIAAQDPPNRIYIATSSSPALVNQWLVAAEAGSNIGWSKDSSLATNLTVKHDARYIDPTANPNGLVLADTDTGNYLFGALDTDVTFAKNDQGVDFFTAFFLPPKANGPADAGVVVLPMVNNIVKSVELRDEFTDFLGARPGEKKGLDVLQVCGGDGEGEMPYFLIMADGYVSECQNVTLKYV